MHNVSGEWYNNDKNTRARPSKKKKKNGMALNVTTSHCNTSNLDEDLIEVRDIIRSARVSIDSPSWDGESACWARVVINSVGGRIGGVGCGNG